MHNLFASETWFLAQIKPNSFRIADRNLHRQGFSTFLPLMTETTRRGSRFIDKVCPLFPGYLFVAFDPGKGGWRAVNSTWGVSRLVQFGGIPAPVPPQIVGGLMARCDPEGKIEPQSGFKPNDVVKIVKGPFARFVATVETLAPDQRIWLLLDILGQTTRTVVPTSAVQITAAG